MLERAREAILKSDLAGAVAMCENCAHPLGSVAPDVLSDPGATPRAIEERLQILLSQQKLLLERNVGLLGTMAAIAPLIGLLGTVWGIMRAFHDMLQTGSAAPTIVTGGLAWPGVTYSYVFEAYDRAGNKRRMVGEGFTIRARPPHRSPRPRVHG